MSAQKGHNFKKALISTTGLLVLLVIIILLNVIFSFANIRWDTTQEKIYTLSDGTKTILSNMEQPLVVKFFYNETNRNIPANLKLYSRRVKDFLSEYEQMSGEKLRVEMVDPKEDSDEEEWARKYGLKGFQVAGDEKIYCGLVFLAADQEDKIEFLDPSREDLLEYDVTRIIQRLQNPKKKVIGIVTGLPVFGAGRGMPFQQQGGAEPWLFVTEMRKTYDVRPIAPTDDQIGARRPSGAAPPQGPAGQNAVRGRSVCLVWWECAGLRGPSVRGGHKPAAGISPAVRFESGNALLGMGNQHGQRQGPHGHGSSHAASTRQHCGR